MKFAFCLFNYFPFGGLQRDFMRIATTALKRGHQVHVYTMQWQGEMNPALPVTVLATKGWQNHTRTAHFAERLTKHLDGYDKVVGFNKMPHLDIYYAADTCYQAKARAQHGTWYRIMPRYKQKVAFENAVFAPEKKTKILLIAANQQTEFMHYYQTPAARFHVLPPGISPDRKAPDNAEAIRHAVRQELGVAPDGWLLLMIGSGFKTKGLDRILQGMASLPDMLRTKTTLAVLGNDHPQKFMKLAKHLKIARNVHFLGGRHDVERFLCAADVLVHPAYNENTGTVLLEALVAGLPVLTTAVCGYARYITEARAGVVLAEPFSQDAFNRTLATILTSPEQRVAWRHHALQFAEYADIYQMPERAVDLLERL